MIRSEVSRDLSLDEVAEFVGLSKYYFAREFRRVTGYTFVTYVNLMRCERAKVLLAQNKLNIGEVGRACGFSNQSYFTRTFRAYTGRLPGVYRETHLQKNEKK
jgi:AraC-like DNA-binding protein